LSQFVIMVVRKRFRNLVHVLALYAVAGLCVAYFLYHAQIGSRGLSSKQNLQAEISQHARQLAELKSERKQWEERAELMRRDATEKDILDERVREVLGRVHRNDAVIMAR
jgi:cell division protein FtsB